MLYERPHQNLRKLWFPNCPSAPPVTELGSGSGIIEAQFLIIEH